MNYPPRLCYLFWIACLLVPQAAVPAVASAVEPKSTASLVVLPNDGRDLFTTAFASARQEIRIEICVLEDPGILGALQAALKRGVRIRAIVDRGKYLTTQAEQANLAKFLTAAGGELHLSNPIFPRSFPKVILIDNREFLVGSACLDQTTFEEYRDFAFRDRNAGDIQELARLFENDWAYSSAPEQTPPSFNPTPALKMKNLMVAPVNAAARMIGLYQSARKTLDVYTELLGNPTLQSELASAVQRGVRVRLIAPEVVNNAPESVQQIQAKALAQLHAAGIAVRVSGPTIDFQHPYMHARAVIADKKRVFLGSISLSPDSITFNREVGLLLADPAVKRAIAQQFDFDFQHRSHTFTAE
ncbi:MAG: phospholipase D-like domain-containing protein [Methylococcaceae bacterium]|nr:phospholipase D-like domain-containing protein [Methylococcaceae bacterium]